MTDHTNNPEPAQAEARHVSPYSTREKIGRMVWALVQATLFRFSLPTAYGWRRFLLRRFGATLSSSAVIRRTVRIECPWNLTMGQNTCLGDYSIAYCLGPIHLADRVSVSQRVHLCAGSHDYTKADMPLLRPPIAIEKDAWIAADAFVGPDVTIREGALLGARGCAFGDLEPWTIYGGNPAKAIGPRQYETPAES